MKPAENLNEIEAQLRAIKDKKNTEKPPITHAEPEKRLEHLRYYIRLFGKDKKMKPYAVLLDLRVQGYSTEYISNVFSMPEKEFVDAEIEAMERLKDFIRKMQDKGVPIVQGNN